ncbi:uncharacterized protein BDV17DRAFT_39626 [Aspergillus undulatus]|uniref:uncharacterized protein n=1 Tax=Aspergillus undulatus TaxID=1810928 RepID=UPI003CCD523C
MVEVRKNKQQEAARGLGTTSPDWSSPRIWPLAVSSVSSPSSPSASFQGSPAPFQNSAAVRPLAAFRRRDSDCRTRCTRGVPTSHLRLPFISSLVLCEIWTCPFVQQTKRLQFLKTVILTSSPGQASGTSLELWKPSTISNFFDITSHAGRSSTALLEVSNLRVVQEAERTLASSQIVLDLVGLLG